MKDEEILKITKPGDLFSNDENKCKLQYKNLIKIYHPDAEKGDETVFKHITDLYKKALDLFQKGEWEKSSYICLKTLKRKTLHIPYLTKFSFELGIAYVCKNHLIYVLNVGNEKYYHNFLAKVKLLKYENKEMEKVMKRTVPEIVSYGQLASSEFYIVLNKTEDVYPLRDVLSATKEIPGKHIAWIISRLSSLCCYLEYSGLVHNGIDINSCFISPKYHSILLLGGWWYATEKGSSMIGTTKGIYDLMPITAKTSKKSETATDLESIKRIGLNLYHEINCRTLSNRKDIEKPIIDFLTKGSGDQAIEEMRIWDEKLNQAYGERKFIKWNITEQEIYKK